MGRLPPHARSLVILLLIGLFQLMGVVSIGAAFKAAARAEAGGGKSQTTAQVMPDEEGVDEVVMDEHTLAQAVPCSGSRWEHEHLPPAPVHLEREGRPPSA